jgi:hypothetical protein
MAKKDTKIIDQTWAKVNKNGTPDMRFVGNYQIPVVRYGEYQLSATNGLSEAYNISNYEFAETFANEFLNYVSMLKNPTGFLATDNNSSAIVSQQEFDLSERGTFWDIDGFIISLILLNVIAVILKVDILGAVSGSVALLLFFAWLCEVAKK